MTPAYRVIFAHKETGRVQEYRVVSQTLGGALVQARWQLEAECPDHAEWRATSAAEVTS